MIESVPAVVLVQVTGACPALSVNACRGQPTLGPVFWTKSRQKPETGPPRCGSVSVAVIVWLVPTVAEVSDGASVSWYPAAPAAPLGHAPGSA